MRIQTDKETLTLQDITLICTRHDAFRQHVERLKGYYVGKHDILHKPQRANDAPNNRLVANYCEYIANMATGFFMGKPVAYASLAETQDEMTALLNIYKRNDEAAHNLALAEEASITGAAYELLWLDNAANLRFGVIPAEEAILIEDSTLEENPVCALRHYRAYALDGVTYEERVDLYNKQELQKYLLVGGTPRLLSTEAHYFGDVPMVEYRNNRLARGDFEGVISLVDAYNKAQSLTLDDMEDFTDAYLILKGMGGTNADDVRELRRNKVLSLDDGGGAEWLTKNINDEYIEHVKARLQRDIHKFSGVPDMSDEAFAGNATGVAIRYKLLGLEQIRSRKEREFRRGLLRRIALIANILHLKNEADIDGNNVEITFTANIPADNEAQANIVKSLYGLVSQKKLLSLLPFIDNPAFKVTEKRFVYIMVMLYEAGYIDGIEPIPLGGEDGMDFKLVSPSITLKGLEYLVENDLMQKARHALQGTKDINPRR